MPSTRSFFGDKASKFMRTFYTHFDFFDNGECIWLFQASSHSSFKLSPLPKSSSIEAEIDGRRKSPANSVASALQQPPISIKQEASELAGSPQVHLNNPLNHNLLPVSTSNFFSPFHLSLSLSLFLFFHNFSPPTQQKKIFHIFFARFLKAKEFF